MDCTAQNNGEAARIERLVERRQIDLLFRGMLQALWTATAIILVLVVIFWSLEFQ